MTVKRPAVGAEGFVLDHYDRSAIETHLHAVGDRLHGRRLATNLRTRSSAIAWRTTDPIGPAI